ncbi:MAG: hypothetical protein ACE5F1_06000 [Planctomycetota bacterium]
MKRLDLYLGKRMLAATTLFLLLFTLASLLLVRREHLAMDWRWLAYSSLPPSLLLAALYTLERGQRLGEARAAAMCGLSASGTWRSLTWVAALSCLMLAALPPTSRESGRLLGEVLRVPAGSANTAWIGRGFLLGGNAAGAADGLLLLRYGAAPRFLEAPRIEREEGRYYLLDGDERLALRSARGSRQLRRQLIATRPLEALLRWHEARIAVMHLVFLLFSSLLPRMLLRQAMRLGWMRGRRAALLVSLVFPLLSAVGLLWVLEAHQAELIGDAVALGLAGLLLAGVSV